MHPSFVDLAALQKVQWIFPPTSSLIKYYHLHSAKLGKTAEGINDSPRIKQQLSNRKRRSLWRLDRMDPRYLSDREMFSNPSLPGTLWTRRALHHCFRHLKIVPMQFQDAFLEFHGAQDPLIPPPAQRLTPHHRCLSVPLCVTALTPGVHIYVADWIIWLIWAVCLLLKYLRIHSNVTTSIYYLLNQI